MPQKKQSWLPFKQARYYVQNLQFKTSEEYLEWVRSGKAPSDLPRAPQKVYKKHGWLSWGDWLGTGFVSFQSREYLPFKEARKYVRSLHFQNTAQFKKWTKTKNKPPNITTTPHITYKDKGWISWIDFLGTNNINTKDIEFRSFEEARDFARKLGIQSLRHWDDWANGKLFHPKAKPEDIPKSPSKYYKGKGWTNWSDFLGTQNTYKFKKNYRPFKKARKFAQSLRLNSREEWKTWAKGKLEKIDLPKKPDDIPITPTHVYKEDGWISWGDWLGTGRVVHQNKKNFYSFKEAKKYVHKLKLQNYEEWLVWAKSEKRPSFIPHSPERVYKKEGWKSLGDWLGTNTVAPKDKQFLPFDKAKKFARNLNLKTVKEWQNWAKTKKRPENIPASPRSVYKKEWIDWRDWLGENNSFTYKKNAKPFPQAKKFVQALQIKTYKEWTLWIKGELHHLPEKPKDIPRCPNAVYKDDWKGWPDFLGTPRKYKNEN